MSRDPKDLVPILQNAWAKAAAEWNADKNRPTVFLTCTHRTPAEQRALYNQPTDGKDNDGDGRIDESDERVTWTLNSKHTRYPAEALDVAFKRGKAIDWNADLFKQFAKIIGKHEPKIIWGGGWKSPDYPHFEI